MAAETDLAPDAAALINKLLSDFAQHAGSADAHAQLDWLIDLLILRGHLNENHRSMIKRMRAPKHLPVVLAVPAETPEPDIDCASLMHLCHGRCCTLTVALTEAEVFSGKVRWDLQAPYTLAKAKTGYCSNLNADGGCSCYTVRPTTCRKFDCRNDVRIWLDFDQRIPAPLALDIVPVGAWIKDD